MTGKDTIVTWGIGMGRFKDIERIPGKHVELPGDTEFTYPNGKIVTIQEAADEFEEGMRLARGEELAEPEDLFLRIASHNTRTGEIGTPSSNSIRYIFIIKMGQWTVTGSSITRFM
ncbi:hypothetical protein [Cohnella fermenti]|uniref:Uncharacterized protein n=1 Tax=Cohnella fermenti TaxID=2565925 RepID=A0A4S4C810_9BACL|nr:hypothetical protein [Cohnella fermenti]THF84133.1 hypothetical protein E6C55_02180 [Cohnella fermenti]